MAEAASAGGEGPARWLVCFHARCASRVARMIPGRFKHVSAIGWCPASKVWIFYDPAMTGTRIWVARDEAALGEWIDDATVVETPPARPVGMASIGLWCVPAVRRLTGTPGRALRPDAFLKDCLRHGGRVIVHDEGAETGGRSRSGEAEGGRGARPA